jgi:hypothetical protein
MDTIIVVVVLCSALLMIVGGLVGHSLSEHILAGELRRHTELRRQIGEQWRQISAERAQGRCPRCDRAIYDGQTSAVTHFGVPT